ncbi:hypothetical protein AAG906_019630 [Vitis piasezkii]
MMIGLRYSVGIGGTPQVQILEGTITGPQPPYTQSDWNTVNAMLVSWITNTIDPEVKSTLSKFRDAKRLWEHLKQRYAMVNGPRIQQLKTSIAKCEQPKSMSVTTYYGKLNVLWEELFKHEPLISCNCCSSCTAASLHHARREQGKLHDFLMGLNTDLYAQLRTNILSQDPLPSLDRAYQLVIQDERVRLAKAVTEDKPTEVLGFAVRTGAGRGRGKMERPVCSHCKKTGHETSTCWSLVACPHCHKHGHDKNNCYEIVGYPEGWLDQNKADGVLGRSPRANAASSIVGASSTKSSTDQLFTPNNGKLFLPNGESLLRPNPVPFVCRITSLLKRSLCAKLNCNLLSVSQLIDDLHCIVQFNSYMCAIQTTRGAIGRVVAQKDGTSLRESSEVTSSVSNLKGSLNKACEICFRAKHPRDKFPLSDNKATRILGKYIVICGALINIVCGFICWSIKRSFRMFMSFIAMADRQFSQAVKVVQSDNGTNLNAYLTIFSVFYSKLLRKHKHILNVGRALRFQANLPIYFWGESVLAAAHLINRTPSPLLHNKTPFEILFGTPPSYAAIHTFGCLSFAHDQKSKGDKFASRSRKCVFLGYPFGKKGWKLFDLDTKELFVSRDVKFFEDVFPFGNPGAVNIIPENIVPTVNVEIDSDFADFVDDDADLPNPQAQTQNPEASSAPLSPKPEVVPTVGLDSLGLDNTSNGQSAPMGKGMRDKFPSVLLRDFVTHTVVAESPSPPLPHYINCDNFLHYRKFLAAIISSNDPKSFKEAMKDVGWQKSMHEEIRALEENGTWTLEPLPKGSVLWEVGGFLNQLVVLGNHQEAGIDYHETFSPVAKMTMVRAFLAIAASKNWELHQMDVHNAFLHGDLEEEVYMKLPPGFERSDPNLVCRLRKSLYGLKQAPRCWFAKLVTALKGYGFLQSYSDYSLFTYTTGNVQINVLVYTFKAYLVDCFKMKDLGVLKYFLGIEVAGGSAGLFLCQRKYTLDIVSEADSGAKPCGFPIEQNHRLGLANGELLSNHESYRRLVGRLIYLAMTPRIEHWEAALRVVRYLKGTPGQGILLRADSDLSLQGWCDSDWAACPVTRRSLSGWLVFLGQSPISWKTKKQHTLPLICRIEYRAMAITCELKWLKGCFELGFAPPKDNQALLWFDCSSYVPLVTQLADILQRLLERNN